MQAGLMGTAPRIEDTGEPRAQKCACVVRRRAGGKGMQMQYLACGLSDFTPASNRARGAQKRPDTPERPPIC